MIALNDPFVEPTTLEGQTALILEAAWFIRRALLIRRVNEAAFVFRALAASAPDFSCKRAREEAEKHVRDLGPRVADLARELADAAA